VLDWLGWLLIVVGDAAQKRVSLTIASGNRLAVIHGHGFSLPRSRHDYWLEVLVT